MPRLQVRTGKRKHRAGASSVHFLYSRVIPGKGSFLLECVLAQTAGGADPIRRDLLPGGSGGDAVLGIAYRGIIDVAAGANILIHDSTFFHSIRSSASAGPRKPCRGGLRREPSRRLADGQAASRPMGTSVSSGFPATPPVIVSNASLHSLPSKSATFYPLLGGYDYGKTGNDQSKFL